MSYCLTMAVGLLLYFVAFVVLSLAWRLLKGSGVMEKKMKDGEGYLRCPNCGYTDCPHEFVSDDAGQTQCDQCDFAAPEQVFIDAYSPEQKHGSQRKED